MKYPSSLNILFWLCLYLLEKATSQTNYSIVSPCDNCMSLCRDAWFEKKFSAEICPHCMGECTDDNDAIASFFNNHACINLRSLQVSLSLSTAMTSPTANLSSSLCEGINNAVHRTVQQGLLFLFNQCKSDLILVREQLHFEEWIISENEGRFVDPAQFNSSEVDNASPSIRSGETHTNQVCPSTSGYESPPTALHMSGISVQLLERKNLSQVFHVSRCSPQSPLAEVVGATCRTIQIKHRALFRINFIQYQIARLSRHPFAGCRRSKLGYIACDDWIFLDGYCALFL